MCNTQLVFYTIDFHYFVCFLLNFFHWVASFSANDGSWDDGFNSDAHVRDFTRLSPWQVYSIADDCENGKKITSEVWSVPQ